MLALAHLRRYRMSLAPPFFSLSFLGAPFATLSELTTLMVGGHANTEATFVGRSRNPCLLLGLAEGWDAGLILAVNSNNMQHATCCGSLGPYNMRRLAGMGGAIACLPCLFCFALLGVSSELAPVLTEWISFRYRPTVTRYVSLSSKERMMRWPVVSSHYPWVLGYLGMLESLHWAVCFVDRLPI